MTEGRRRLVVVDTETTGLDVLRHDVLEIACVDVDTHEEFYFVPVPPEGAFDRADPDALRINRYFERGVYEYRGGAETWYSLWRFLKGCTFAGSNPAFDSIMLLRGFHLTSQSARSKTLPSWHHRLADLAAYAAPALGVSPSESKGLADVCKALGVPPGDHTAKADARATADCFRILAKQYSRVVFGMPHG